MEVENGLHYLRQLDEEEISLCSTCEFEFSHMTDEHNSL